MNQSLTPLPSTLGYSLTSQQRAALALHCAPFGLTLYRRMEKESVWLPTIAGERGVKEGFTQKPLSEAQTERELMWLIRAGLLRREVDGQGITDGFRLTPLAKHLLGAYSPDVTQFPRPTVGDRLQNSWNRWGFLRY